MKEKILKELYALTVNVLGVGNEEVSCLHINNIKSLIDKSTIRCKEEDSKKFKEINELILKLEKTQKEINRGEEAIAKINAVKFRFSNIW